MKLGDKIFHHAYGFGMVLQVKESIVRILWDDPELSRWEDEPVRETFWTELIDVAFVEEYSE